MKNDLTIYVSGLYSGTNPQPGIGIARSLRAGFPNAKIIGVEYSARCSGVHWDDFDEIWLQRPWNELNLDMHAEEIRKRLDDGGFWISSIDLEILWLAQIFPDGHHGLLSPGLDALDRVQKPEIKAHQGLGVKIPPYVTTDELTDWELHAFCREHDWKVWLKGPFYEAIRTPNWPTLEGWRSVLSKAWATERLFLQAHVTGYEESIMLSAHRGELLDATYMRKRDVTELGKTWAGDTRDLDPEMLERVRKTVRDLNWTGGGEVEMVRDANDDLWMLEMNPRFPAWVHGSTITGKNLPAILVEAASGVSALTSAASGEEFTRVVIEVPVKEDFPLSPLAEPYAGGIGHSMKHPSGLIEFAQKMRDERTGGETIEESAAAIGAPEESAPESYLTDLKSIDVSSLQTPVSLFFPNTASQAFQTAKISSDGSPLRMIQGYSIKTNPDERMIKLALEAGFYAEAISPLEAAKAVKVGFRTDQVILNGPAKWWRREALPDGELHAIFCDSTEEIKQVAEELKTGKLRTQIAGVRLRTPNIPSRFGIPIDSPLLFGELINAIKLLPRDTKFGVHFHMASSNVGIGQWRHLLQAMLRWCGSIEALSGRVIECLDIGGGWFPGDGKRTEKFNFTELGNIVRENLSSVSEIISEPGKAIAQPAFGLAMSVLEIRRYLGGSTEVVMDGSIAELPMYSFQPHRILSQCKESGEWRPLKRGDAMLLGRLCMEHDIVATNIDLPETTQPGDVLIFCDAGAYDRSMSYVFGCG
jgi:diaminopimelate decarboxylase